MFQGVYQLILRVRRRKGKRGGKGKGREGRENDLTHPLSQIPGYTTGLWTIVLKQRPQDDGRLPLEVCDIGLYAWI